MEWQVRYEPVTRDMPWNVYKNFDGQRVFQKGFMSEDEARLWAGRAEAESERPQDGRLSKVDEASIQSFPASDPPAWTKTTAAPGKGKAG